MFLATECYHFNAVKEADDNHTVTSLVCAALSTCISISLLPGKFDYDLVVIGGGSGGLACSKEGEAAFQLYSV